MSAAVFFFLLLALHVAVSALLFTLPRSRKTLVWFFAPSAVLAWVAYGLYEAIYIKSHCSGDCAIRADLMLIVPVLLYLTLAALIYGSKVRN
jgi:hypothetical protein